MRLHICHGSARCVNKTLCAFNRTKLNTVSNEPYDLFIAVCVCVCAWDRIRHASTHSVGNIFRIGAHFDRCLIQFTIQQQPLDHNLSNGVSSLFECVVVCSVCSHTPTVSALVCRSLSQFISDAIHLYQKLISRTHQRAISSLRLGAEFMSDDRRGVGLKLEFVRDALACNTFATFLFV